MRDLIRTTKHRLIDLCPAGVYVPVVNAFGAVKGRKHRISAIGGGLYRVEDGETAIVIARRSRHRRYKRGIHVWVDRLAAQYRLAGLRVQPGGVFIDCGANVGELGFWARRNGLCYHAFEPESQEARCCDLNNFEGNEGTRRCGLWFESGELKLYSKAGSADSSLIETADYDAVSIVPTITLDQYVRDQGIERIEVLKIEAEGAEPEVLRGARESLRKSRFVTVDCGPERGLERTDTLRDVCNALYGSGFEMIDSDTERMSVLFENRAVAANRAAA